MQPLKLTEQILAMQALGLLPFWQFFRKSRSSANMTL
jgi:hypothetical protein